MHKAIPQPALLYNAAQAYRLGGDGPKALEYYRVFLKEAPQAKQRPDVERRIAELENKTVLVKAPPDMSTPAPSPRRPPPPSPSPSTSTEAAIACKRSRSSSSRIAPAFAPASTSGPRRTPASTAASP